VKVSEDASAGSTSVGGERPRASDARALATLLSSARHELRSPLQALLGFTELLEAGTYGALSAPQLAFIEHMRTAGKDLAHTVDACADLVSALISPKAVGSDPSTTELAAAVRSALAEPLAGTTVRAYEAEPTPAVRVRCEHGALTRVLSELLSVVGQKSQAHVSLHSRDEGNGTVRVTLSADRRPAADEALLTVDAALALGKASRALLFLKLAEEQLVPYGARVLTLASQRDVVLLLLAA
jgi:light-regulated signal transduction histidine kinase (bacteriophytochrome)